MVANPPSICKSDRKQIKVINILERKDTYYENNENQENSQNTNARWCSKICLLKPIEKSGEPDENRTRDTLIKSQVRCQTALLILIYRRKGTNHRSEYQKFYKEACQEKSQLSIFTLCGGY